MKADDKERNLYWRGAVAYFRMRVAGKDHWESLGEITPQAARQLVRDKRRAAALDGYLDRWDQAKQRQSFATIGEICTAYLAYSAGADLGSRTAGDYVAALRRIVGRVHPGEADAQRSSVLTAELLLDYESQAIAGVKQNAVAERWEREEAEEAMETALRTVHSTAQQARAVFAARALQSEAMRDLHLPNLQPFLGAVVGRQTIRRYAPWPTAARAAFVAGLSGLRTSDPAAWVVAVLAANTGMRRSSIIAARWDWIDRTAGTIRVAVAKGGRSTVGISPATLSALESIATSPTWIVPGDSEADRTAAADRLVTWLRTVCHVDSRAPLHDLRKMHGDLRRQTHGTSDAQAALGHSSPELTTKVYSQSTAPEAVDVIAI